MNHTDELEIEGNPDTTSDIPRSRTLEQLAPGHYPDTVCTSCPNAVWHAYKGKTKPLPYCLVMHTVIDADLTACDGNPNL